MSTSSFFQITSMPPPSTRRTRQSSSSEGEQPVISKRVTFSESSPTTASDDSDGVSAREQRSRRRQEKVDTEQVLSLHNTRNKRSHFPSDSVSNKKMRANDDNVVVVQLLTGTLYLYKGPHRRAEFVRQI
jgi:hypothetical protein